MFKFVPPSPVSPQPPSRASSESETQSVTDEQTMPMSSFASRLAKAANKKKDTKDAEKERPPWRATAKPIKEPNTNALLKAKLLDASRRALRAMKINSVSCQTDFQPTVLMKEVGICAQKDLIHQRDVGILTDGTITVRNIPPGTLFFTHTISQMTELMNMNDAGTQTALPTSRIGSLMRFTSSEEFDSVDRALEVNAEKIKNQAEELRDVDEDINIINRSYLRRRPSLSLDPEAAERFHLLMQQQNDDDDEEEDEDSDDENYLKRSAIKLQKFNLENSSTSSQWNNLETSDEESDEEGANSYPHEQRRKSIDRENNLFIRARLRNMQLAPILPQHHRKDSLKSTPGWTASQTRAVADILSQVSELFDLFDDISILLGPDLRFIRDLPMGGVDMQVPQLKCGLVIKKSRENLSEKLSKIKLIPLDSDKSLSEEFLKYAE
ncbi:hypothetical protein DMENIID0001_133610 [Sergentomyia squamirostris]